MDTSALISFFQGNSALSFLTSVPVGMSIISIFEFLSFPYIDEKARILLFGLVEKLEVFDLKKDDGDLIDAISKVRIESKMKLPDAIIAGAAILNNAILISNDRGFSKSLYFKLSASN